MLPPIQLWAPPTLRRIKRPKHWFHDFETYCDLNLKEVGLSRYARHPSCEPLMLAYADDFQPVEQWVPAEGQRMPDIIEDRLLDERVLKAAWNAQFERAIWMYCMGYNDLPAIQWRDTMVLAFTLSFPGKLERAAEIIGLSEAHLDLKARGTHLIRKFCTPRRPSKNNPRTRLDHTTNPAEWQEFKEYNVGDVVSEVDFYKRTFVYDLPPHEWENWAIDQEINEAGFPVNMKVVNNAVQVVSDLNRMYISEMAELTGLPNPNSPDQLLPWLKEEKYVFDDLKKGHIARALDEIDDPKSTLARVLRLRQRSSKASVKKYKAIQNAVDDDGFLRYTIQFAGAQRTWRFSGRRFQPQNLAKPAIGFGKKQQQIEAVKWLESMSAVELELVFRNPMDALSTCIRPTVQAPEGWTFGICDLNAIENRVLGYMAQDKKILEVFENKRDPYIDFATYMFQQPYDVLKAENEAGNKEKRTTAKPGVLGCGYMLGSGSSYENDVTGEIEATGLLGYAWNMGITSFTQEQSNLSVKVWRETYHDAVEFWWRIDKAARKCLTTGDPVECWPVTFDRKGPFMRMLLPSGRHLHYCRPRIEKQKGRWGEAWIKRAVARKMKTDKVDEPTALAIVLASKDGIAYLEDQKKEYTAITYEGLSINNYWTRINTHPGKLTENADQAISRDLLMNGIRILHKMGIIVRLHAHDELVILCREEDKEDAFKALFEAMTTPPKWAPTMPLGAEGFTSRWYLKG